jgi:uncharacterized membrane protein HdeD (DUF308 family)
MRSLTMIVNLLVVGTGTFCIANSSVPFTSVSFIVGIAILIMGVCELAINRMANVGMYESEKDVNVEGFTSVVLGIVFLANQVTETVAVTVLFALWMTLEGLKTLSSVNFNLRLQSVRERFTELLGVCMTLCGIYMFFNTQLLNLKTLTMVGAALFMLGLSRFRIALSIEYRAPDMLTGNEERLADAKRDEKRAMKKAKEGIRETKEARERMAKARKAIDKEKSMMRITERRRSKDTEKK